MKMIGNVSDWLSYACGALIKVADSAGSTVYSKFHASSQRSRGRQIRRPGTRKLLLGRIILPRDDSRDARFFRRETSQNSHLYLGFVVY